MAENGLLYITMDKYQQHGQSMPEAYRKKMIKYKMHAKHRHFHDVIDWMVKNGCRIEQECMC